MNFLANFGHIYSVSEVIDRLRKTTFRASKTSIMGYILKMQEIASRAEIDEQQTIQFIIEGFQDNSAHIAILYPAKTISELKQLSHRYSQLLDIHQANHNSSVVPINSFRPKPKPGTSGMSSASSVAPRSQVQCYNCSGFGHRSDECKEKKRPKGSCFRCGSVQHILKDCPTPRPPPNENRVALISGSSQDDIDDEELSSAISELNKVSVTFLTKCSVQLSKDSVTLFDSGSPVNLMQCSEVPKQVIPSKAMECTDYKGIGNFKICTYGVISIKIKFRKITKDIKVFIVPDNYIPYPLLLGRSFLRAFKIHFVMDEPTANIIWKPKIELDLNLGRNRIRISDKILHCVYSSDGDKERDILLECELCRRLPYACIANCDSVGDEVSVSKQTSIENISEHPDNNIDRAFFKL